MGNISNLLGGPLRSHKSHELSPEDQFLNAIYAEGFDAPDNLICDGHIHRFRSGQKSDKSGWYILNKGLSGPSFGAFGDWRTGQTFKFASKMDREMTMVEQMNYRKQMDEMLRLKEAESKVTYEAKSDAVKKIWDSATAASLDHPYLKRKGILSHGAKVTGDGRLVLPIYTPEGELNALQFIDGDGKKRFENSVTGGLHVIGPTDSSIAYLVEGFADAATVVEETRCACYIAYSGSNMVKVAQTIKSMGGHSKIVVVADNDNHGKGQEWAEKAAKTIGSACLVPPKEGDVNDFRQGGGDVLGLLQPKVEKSWLVKGLDFCQKPAPIRWLIKGWLQEEALMMVHGPSGGGKTFLVLDMILRVASDYGSWHGSKVKHGEVVYLAGEGHHGLKGRLKGWIDYHDVDDLSLWVSQTGLDLNTPDGYLKTIQSIKDCGSKPSLIVVDTLHRFLNGDENSSVDAKTMLDACAGLIEEFGCSVLLVHHTGVSDAAQDRARGSSAWRGALDIEISVKPGDKDKGEPMVVRQMKSKDAELEDERYFKLESVPVQGWIDEDGEQVTTAILEKSEKSLKENSKIKEHLKTIEDAWLEGARQRTQADEPYLTFQDLLGFLMANRGMKEGAARQALKPSQSNRLLSDLLKAKKVEKDGELIIVKDEGLLSIFRVLEKS